MSTKQKRILWPALLIAALALSAFTFAAARKLRGPRAVIGRPTKSQNPRAEASASRTVYVRRGALRPQLILNLVALGDRLEKQGKERLTVAGTFSRSDDPRPLRYVAVIEFPDRLRLRIQNGVQTRVVTFDGEQAKAVGNSLDTAERDLIETLVYDTAEHFFAAQMQGQATRSLGSRFRTDDGSSANYGGPYYDIYQVGEPLKASADQRQSAKHYYFNSDTLLLERVRYALERNGSTIEIETVVGGWQKENGQEIARRIERRENGRAVFALTINAVNVSPRVDDGIFTSTAAN